MRELNQEYTENFCLCFDEGETYYETLKLEEVHNYGYWCSVVIDRLKNMLDRNIFDNYIFNNVENYYLSHISDMKFIDIEDVNVQVDITDSIKQAIKYLKS